MSYINIYIYIHIHIDICAFIYICIYIYMEKKLDSWSLWNGHSLVDICILKDIYFLTRECRVEQEARVVLCILHHRV